MIEGHEQSITSMKETTEAILEQFNEDEALLASGQGEQTNQDNIRPTYSTSYGSKCQTEEFASRLTPVSWSIKARQWSL